ncbi:MAG: hypothetical protein QOD95_1961, partial [Gammaproteobacteria bacterium]|nr:hypothetical protein [Gammaproteobacteria bacterium]
PGGTGLGQIGPLLAAGETAIAVEGRSLKWLPL